MSPDSAERLAANKRVVRRFVDEIWEKGNLDAVDALCTQNAVLHDPDGHHHGRTAFAEYYRTFLDAFPDLEYEVEDVVAEGDRVVLRTRLRGTHRGEFRGVEPTDTRLEATETVLARIQGSKIAEQWAVHEAVGLGRQLELLPATANRNDGPTVETGE